MNREIKFRAVLGVNSGKPTSIEYFDLSLDDDITRLRNADYDINQLMQYTGLKDKNGVEIYEGDICKCHYFYEALGENLGVYEAEKEIIGEIVFQEMGLWIQSNTEEDSGYLLWNNGLHENSFEVIGNIYENPEPLK